MDAYEQLIRKPGDEISSGSDIFKTFGYTDVCNPIYSFDLMNDSNFGYLKDCIENEKAIPERYNANVIRLRDYRLGGMINDFRELCNSALTPYEESWEEYRAEYNTKMPEEFYSFWMIYDEVTIGKILPKFINLIDPISMEWIDPEYPKVTMEDGVYQYGLDAPIVTSNPLFLLPETKMEYLFYEPYCDPITAIYEEVSEEIAEHIPDWLFITDIMNNELTNAKPKTGETEIQFISRTKNEIRTRFKRYKK